MLVVVPVTFAIVVVSSGLVIVRVLSTDHCSRARLAQLECNIFVDYACTKFAT